MNKEFIPYEEALTLKKLGFSQECFAWYRDKSLTMEQQGDYYVMYGVDAPLYQQAFRWFRDKGFVIQPIPEEIEVEGGFVDLFYSFKISKYDGWRGGRRNTVQTCSMETYEEAELECLRKLIEIVKQEQDEKRM